MTSSSELFDSMFKPNVSSTTLKRALQYVSMYSIQSWLLYLYAMTTVVLVKR